MPLMESSDQAIKMGRPLNDSLRGEIRRDRDYRNYHVKYIMLLLRIHDHSQVDLEFKIADKTLEIKLNQPQWNPFHF